MRNLIVLVTLCVTSVITEPRILTKGGKFEVREGSTIELPCKFDGDGSEMSISWKRAPNDLIALDDEVMSGDERYEVRIEGQVSTLVINKASPIDAADYLCSMDEVDVNISHHVDVLVPPRVHISPDEASIVVTHGERVTIRCTASGNPHPEVKWSMKASKIATDVEVKRGSLHFTARQAHAGTYICAASNGIGQQTREIEVQVNDKHETTGKPMAPWVSSDLGYVAVSRGDSTNVSCRYDGNPAPVVEWLFNGYKIKFNQDKFKGATEYDQRESNYTVSVLELKNLDEEIFGDYMCRVANNVGSAQRVIHVSGKPGPPKLELEGTALSWSVESKDPILEYAVLYRVATEDNFNAKELLRSDKRDLTGNNEYTHSVDLKNVLKKGKKYEIQVEARNSVGWGAMARDYVTVEIPEDNTENGNDTSGAVSIVSVTLPTLIIALLWQ